MVRCDWVGAQVAVSRDGVWHRFQVQDCNAKSHFAVTSRAPMRATSSAAAAGGRRHGIGAGSPAAVGGVGEYRGGGAMSPSRRGVFASPASKRRRLGARSTMHKYRMLLVHIHDKGDKAAMSPIVRHRPAHLCLLVSYVCRPHTFDGVLLVCVCVDLMRPAM